MCPLCNSNFMIGCSTQLFQKQSNYSSHGTKILALDAVINQINTLLEVRSSSPIRYYHVMECGGKTMDEISNEISDHQKWMVNKKLALSSVKNKRECLKNLHAYWKLFAKVQLLDFKVHGIEHLTWVLCGVVPVTYLWFSSPKASQRSFKCRSCQGVIQRWIVGLVMSLWPVISEHKCCMSRDEMSQIQVEVHKKCYYVNWHKKSLQ